MPAMGFSLDISFPIINNNSIELQPHEGVRENIKAFQPEPSEWPASPPRPAGEALAPRAAPGTSARLYHTA